MKNIIISGSGSGLGLELAKAYAQLDYHVILLGRNEGKLQTASDFINQTGSSEYIVCDITKVEDLENLKSSLDKRITIDCLINNAGVGYFGPLEDLLLSELNKMLSSNVVGTILLTQTLLPLIKGRIINIISTAGLKGKVNEAAYVASKFAVRGFTESLQKELDIPVTAVYMGGMKTPFWDDSDHIKDPSRLMSAADVAKEIILKDDGRLVIKIES